MNGIFLAQQSSKWMYHNTRKYLKDWDKKKTKFKQIVFLPLKSKHAFSCVILIWFYLWAKNVFLEKNNVCLPRFYLPAGVFSSISIGAPLRSAHPSLKRVAYYALILKYNQCKNMCRVGKWWIKYLLVCQKRIVNCRESAALSQTDRQTFQILYFLKIASSISNYIGEIQKINVQGGTSVIALKNYIFIMASCIIIF